MVEIVLFSFGHLCGAVSGPDEWHFSGRKKIEDLNFLVRKVSAVPMFFFLEYAYTNASLYLSFSLLSIINECFSHPIKNLFQNIFQSVNIFNSGVSV